VPAPWTCVVTDPASFSANSFICTVLPEVGAAWRLLLRGTWVTMVAGDQGGSAGYAAPVVTSVVPQNGARWLPNAGGAIVISGAGFGTQQCGVAGSSFVELVTSRAPDNPSTLTFDATARTWEPPVASVVAQAHQPCGVLEWADSQIVCEAPPGIDPTDAVTVRVVAGDQVYLAHGLVGYTPPVLLAMHPSRVMGTTGGGTLTLVGTGFPPPPWPLVVAVGRSLCDVDPASRNSTLVVCRVPRGAGQVSVVVHTPLQSSGNQSFVMLYDGPTVGDVTTPLGRPVEGRFPVHIRGTVSQARLFCACA
jgi:hypothetical protein